MTDTANPVFEIETAIKGWQQKTPFTLDMSPARYGLWQRYATKEGLNTPEELLPRLMCYCSKDLPEFMSRGKPESEELLRNKIKENGPWGFWFSLAPGINTKKIDMHGRNRIVCRSHLISAAVQKFMGKNISDNTVLDIGSHSGFFSLDMAHRGVKSVKGVELRPENIKQAKFLQDHYNINNVEFEQGDITTWQPQHQYSVVLNLGLLYHVIDPISLVRRTYDWCTDFAVIDTVCHHEPVSAFIAAFNKDPNLHAEGLHTAELHPTYRALIDTMYDAGFVDLIELVGDAGVDGRVSDLYRSRNRRCIIGFKTPLAELMVKNGFSVNFNQ